MLSAKMKQLIQIRAVQKIKGRKEKRTNLEHGQELITGGERPRVGAVRDGQQPQRREVQLPVVLRREEAPVEVPALADGDGRAVLRHHLHPRCRVHLKEDCHARMNAL